VAALSSSWHVSQGIHLQSWKKVVMISGGGGGDGDKKEDDVFNVS